jgi:hypothetical protein
VRKIINRHNDLMTTLRQKLAEVDRDGEGRPQWKSEKRAEAIDTARAASRTLALELSLAAAQKYVASQDIFNEIRKGGSKVKPAPSEKLFWLQQAQALFNGRKPEQAIELYGYQLKKMTPEERQAWRHVFDDALELATYGDPTLEFKTAQVIGEHRTIDERAALRAMQEATRLQDYAPTLKAIFEANFTEAIENDKQANDPAEVLDVIERDISAELARV